jgi:5-methylcytosine-specific restriction endonuclease McrA
VTERAYRYCKQPGCNVRFRDVGWYCPSHKDDNMVTQGARRRKAADPIWKLYNCAAWTRFTAKFKSDGNIICQRLNDGIRCTSPTAVLHHLVSPRHNPARMYDPTNVVGLCKHCHITTDGEPEQNLKRLHELYVPTIWKPIRF